MFVAIKAEFATFPLYRNEARVQLRKMDVSYNLFYKLALRFRRYLTAGRWP